MTTDAYAITAPNVELAELEALHVALLHDVQEIAESRVALEFKRAGEIIAP